MKPRLVYVLPSYDPDSAEHMYHIYGLLEQLATAMDIYVIVERATQTLQLQGVVSHHLKSRLPVIRSLELLWVLLRARLAGYRRFYTHYSIGAAILAGLVTRLFGGVSYYWNCGHPTDFLPHSIRSLADVRSVAQNRVLLGWALRATHYLVTGTASMAEYYRSAYGVSLARVRVLPNWVDTARFAGLNPSALRRDLHWPSDRHVVLFLHRLAERKGAHQIVPIAVELLRDEEIGSRLFFVVAGDGPYRARLESEIQEAGLQEVFCLAGWVPNREVPHYYGAADVHMMPSFEEGFPRTLLEAMAAGCPFVATDVGGVRDILTEAQQRFVTSPGDAREMAAAVRRLLVDPALRAAMAAEGRAQVDHYRQDRVVELFRQLIAGIDGTDASQPPLRRMDTL